MNFKHLSKSNHWVYIYNSLTFRVNLGWLLKLFSLLFKSKFEFSFILGLLTKIHQNGCNMDFTKQIVIP